MPGTDLAMREDVGAFQMLLDLETAGLVDDVSLNLTDPDLPYEQWEALGRFFGAVDRRSRWLLGDWLIFGEAVYGEAASQGVEATTRERYSEAERVTGLDHGTLLNIRSVCDKVPRRNRRSELGFWIHAEVAKLDEDAQVEWLARAIDEGWNRGRLRDEIRGTLAPPTLDPGPDAPDGDPPLSIGERIEIAARHVFHQGQTTDDGGAFVPAEAWSQLAAALGEE